MKLYKNCGFDQREDFFFFVFSYLVVKIFSPTSNVDTNMQKVLISTFSTDSVKQTHHRFLEKISVDQRQRCSSAFKSVLAVLAPHRVLKLQSNFYQRPPEMNKFLSLSTAAKSAAQQLLTVPSLVFMKPTVYLTIQENQTWSDYSCL